MYGYADGDPINKSDPFGLFPTPAAACLVPAVAPICVTAGQAIAAAGIAAVTSVGLFLSGRHRQATEDTETSLGIATEHIGLAAAGPPNGDEDPNWVRDKLKHAQKHINNARESVKKALGRTRRRLEQEIERAQEAVDQLRPPQP